MKKKKVIKGETKFCHGYKDLSNFPDDWSPEFDDKSDNFIYGRFNRRKKHGLQGKEKREI